MEDAEAASNEALRLQMEQALELVRHMLGIIVQAVGFFVAADALLIGYGVSQKKSGRAAARQLHSNWYNC
jgi:hypothetical protein